MLVDVYLLIFFVAFLWMQTAYNVIAYKHKPRLQTAVEMLKTTQEIERRLKEVS